MVITKPCFMLFIRQSKKSHHSASRTIEMKKVWFVDGQIIEQEIPESDIYKHDWDIDSCKEYVKQLRDKTRANTAEHAAQAIEFLLAECDALHKETATGASTSPTNRSYTPPQRTWVGLTDEEIEQVRVAIMGVAYWCADENMPEAYNAKKVCCAHVLGILVKAQEK